MIRNARFVPVVLLLAAALNACSSDDVDTAANKPGANEIVADEIADADKGAPSTSATDVLAGFSSCDDVSPAVAQYIVGLQEAPSNAVDEYGVLCNWETPDGATDLSQVRGVEVLIEPGIGQVPEMRDLEAGGLVILPDAVIEDSGGVAYTFPVATSVVGVVVTTIETPDVKVTITGGQWDDMPALDGPAAVSAAKQLMGV
ncbi:hypothetical protein ACFRFQ_05155 [Rhodococcus sp. NPDC056743]|uniref:hypothetical protein n=1 Tax=Rhodococcus sp. NPDC056743 TaxID=3345934 RepID=UPI00367226D8